MFYLAQAHRSGEMGVPQNLQKFGEMVQQAAAAGSADAMFALGGTFFHGADGFARDPRAAFRCVVLVSEREKNGNSLRLGVNIIECSSLDVTVLLERLRCRNKQLFTRVAYLTRAIACKTLQSKGAGWGCSGQALELIKQLYEHRPYNRTFPSA